MISQYYFRSDLTSLEAAMLFRQSVQGIEIAISSFCNRRCTYCPNGKADRISSRRQMTDDLFFNVMRQLCRLGYAGRISIHRYNEPLADKDYALKRIREIRAFLPEAKIDVYTNGDYLDAAFVRELADARVTQILVTIHEAPGGSSYAELLENQTRFLNRLGLPFKGVSADERSRCVHVVTGAETELTVWAKNFYQRDEKGVILMQDRGQSLAVERGIRRFAPCEVPFTQMQIEWDGELLPCCQIQPDVFEKDKYTLGRLTPTSDIFLAWTNAHYVGWRKELMSFEPKKTPCATCDWGAPYDTPTLRADIAALRGEDSL